MNQINAHIGTRIRAYRKQRQMTLQQLADQIQKSRASVSKYETGEITLDVETLYKISVALHVDLSQLTDYRPEVLDEPEPVGINRGTYSPFFRARNLYFYFYDGRYDRLKDGVIHIHKTEVFTHECEASFFISSLSPSGRSSELRYTGRVVYSDMLIRFSFVNQYNPLEEDLLYIFNPLEVRNFTEGLLCGISSSDLMPCAFKCLVTLNPCEANDLLREHLMFTPQELKRWQKMNMLIVDNHA